MKFPVCCVLCTEQCLVEDAILFLVQVSGVIDIGTITWPEVLLGLVYLQLLCLICTINRFGHSLEKLGTYLAFLVVLGLSTTQHTRTPHPQIILYVKLVRLYYEFIVCNYKMNLQC